VTQPGSADRAEDDVCKVDAEAGDGPRRSGGPAAVTNSPRCGRTRSLPAVFDCLDAAFRQWYESGQAHSLNDLFEVAP
jgi:hypothetical protein